MKLHLRGGYKTPFRGLTDEAIQAGKDSYIASFSAAEVKDTEALRRAAAARQRQQYARLDAWERRHVRISSSS